MAAPRKIFKNTLFSELFLSFYSLLLVAGFFTMLITSSYFGWRPLEMLSFRSLDLWCDQVTTGIGNHCFSDFQSPITLVNSENPWINGNSFTPSAMIPSLVFFAFNNSFLGLRFSLYFYLLLVTLSLVFPIYKSLKKITGSIRVSLALFLSFFSSAGLNAFDRGTSAVFAIPFVYLAARDFLRGNGNKVLLWSILASLIRPQFIFLLIFLLSLKLFKKFILGIFLFLGSIVIGFLIWPGDRLLHIRSWLAMITNYDQYTESENNWPINISIGKSIARIMNFIAEKFPNHSFLSDLNVWTLNNFAIVGIIWALAVFMLVGIFGSKISKSVVILLILSTPALVPGTSWSYYLVILLPVAGLLISKDEVGTGLLDDDSKLGDFSKFTVVAILSIILSPFVIPFVPNPNLRSPHDPLYTSGLMQISGSLLVTLLIYLFLTELVRLTLTAKVNRKT